MPNLLSDFPVETFVNVRGQMLPDRVAREGETLLAPPFEAFPLDVASLFLL